MPAKKSKAKLSARHKPPPRVQKTTGAKYVYSFDEIRLAERAAGSWDGK